MKYIDLGKNDRGVPFLSTSDGETVRFYDARYPMHGELGQFVSSYYITTLTGECKWSHGDPATLTGVNLHGGVDDWVVSAAQVRQAIG